MTEEFGDANRPWPPTDTGRLTPVLRKGNIANEATPIQAVAPTIPMGGGLLSPLQAGGIIPDGSRVEVFQEIYWVFLILGTLVGVVVIGYMLYNAYKYRDRQDRTYDEADVPELGEVPTGGGKGRKLFLSFAISAVIVISLIVWTYGTLLYVEQGAAQEPPGEGESLNVTVVGFQFGWEFVYPDAPGSSNVSVSGEEFTNVQTSDTLRIPEDRMIRIEVTSRDVFHNFGVAELRVKDDAIPGQWTETWFLADKPGTYQAVCYELCGAGHSYMTATVDVMSQSDFQEWYNGTEAGS